MYKRFIWQILFVSLLVSIFGQTVAAASSAISIVVPASVQSENNNLLNAGSFFDQDTATQPGLQNGRDNTVYFKFSDGFKPEVVKIYLPEKTANGYSLEYLTSTGIWASFPGANMLSGAQLERGWNRFPLSTTVPVNQVRLRITKAGQSTDAGISEIEFWGRTVTGTTAGEKTYHPETDTILELQNGNLFHGAKESVHINIDTQLNAVQKAQLLYEVADLQSYTEGSWEINGNGEHALLAKDVNDGWARVAEEIDPALLTEGKNTITFKISNSKKNALQIKNVAVKLYFATGQQTVAWVEGAGCKDALLPNLIDGDINTFWQTDWRVHDQVSFILHLARKTNIEYLTWSQGKKFLDGIRVEYLTSNGWQLFSHELGARDLLEGWNTLKADTFIQTDQIRFTVLNPRGKQMIGPLQEIAVWGSAAESSQAQPQIVITAPANGEVVGDNFLVKAYIKGDFDRVTVNGENVKLNKKSFEKEMKLSQANRGIRKEIKVEAYQGGNLVSTQNVIVMAVGPTVTIVSPANGSYTTAAQINVMGQTNSIDNNLYINGEPFGSATTNYSVPYTLEEGVNKITVSAIDMDSLSSEQTIYVHRDSHPPVIHFDTDPITVVTANQQTYRITGYVEEYSSCHLYVNNTEIPLQYGAFEYLAPVTLGTNTYQFRAVDQLNQESTAPFTIIYDTTEPDPFTISGVPTGWIGRVTYPQISFTATDSQSGINHYELKIDEGSYENVQSPCQITGLSGGTHTISVKAVNGAGLFRVVTAQIRVDADNPTLFTPTITPSGWTQNKTPVVTFATTDASSGIDHYEIKVDNGTSVTVTSPYTLPTLSDGTHTVTVKAVDNVGQETSVNLQALIDTLPPAAFTPTTQPASPTNNNQPVVKFQTTDAGSGIDHYEVQIDGGSFVRTTSPYTPPVLNDGAHQITVKAFDKAGFSTTGTVEVTIETVAPPTPGNFNAVSDLNNITVSWSAIAVSDLQWYNLYRSPGWSLVDNVWLHSDDLQYVDTQVATGEDYSYYLVAIDTAGNKSAPTPTITRTGGVAQGTITPVGGKVKYGNEVDVNVPEGAMQDSATIQIAPTSTLGVEVPATIVENTTVSDTYQFDVIVHTNVDPAAGDPEDIVLEDPVFEQNLTIALQYDKTKIPAGYTVQDLDVYYYNEADGFWVRMPKQQIDELEQSITFETNHFSMYNVQVTGNYSPSASDYADLGLAPYGTYFQNNEEFVSPSSGSLTVKVNDLNLPGRDGFNLTLGRMYSSSQAIWDQVSENVNMGLANFGAGWRLCIPRIEDNSEGQFLYLEDGTAIKLNWIKGENLNGTRTNTFEYHAGTHLTAAKVQEKSGLHWDNKSYTVYFKDGTKYTFDQSGKLTQKADRTGTSTITYGYDTNGRLTTITDNQPAGTFSRKVNIFYTDTTGRKIQSINVNDVPFITYGYNVNGVLSSVNYRTKQTTSYQYQANEYKVGYTITNRSVTRTYANGEEKDYEPTGGQVRTWQVQLMSKIIYPTKGISTYTYYPGTTTTTHFIIDNVVNFDDGTSYTETGEGDRTDYNYNLRVLDHAQYLTDNTSTTAQNPAHYDYTEATSGQDKYIQSATITNKYQKTEMTFNKDGLNTVKLTYDLTNTNLATWSIKEAYQYNSDKELTDKYVYHGGRSQASFWEKFDYDNWGNMTHKFNSVNNADYYYHYLNTSSRPISSSQFLQSNLTQVAINSRMHDLLADEFYINEDKVNSRVTPVQTHYQYDYNGNLLTKAKRHGNAWVNTSYEYDPVWKGNLTKETDALGGVTDLIYDASKTFVIKTSKDAKINADGTASRLIENQTDYDLLLGLKKSETDPTLAKTEYDYDELGRATLVKYPDSTVSTTDNLLKVTIYDDAKNVVTVANLILGATTLAQAKTDIANIDPNYNAAGVIPEGTATYRIYSLTRYIYDGLNRLKQIRQYLRDSELQKVDNTKLTSPFVTNFEYDEVGNRIAETDAENKVTTKKYDGLGRLTDVYYPTDNTEENHLQIVYSVDTNKRTIIDPDQYWTEEISDWNGNVIEMAKYELKGPATANPLTLGTRFTSLAAYDTAGNQVEIIDGNKQSFKSVYDDWDQLVESIMPPTEAIVPGSTNITTVTPRITYEYDNLGRKTAETAPNGNATTTVNDYRTEYVYDYAGRMIKTIAKRPEGDLTTKSYYDNAGRVTEIVSPENQHSRKIYNTQGWLVAEIDAEGNIAGHEYNALGKEIGITNPNGIKTQGQTGWTTVIIDTITYYFDPAFTTRTAYDSLSRTIQTTDLAGTTLKVFYNKVGAKTAEKIAAGPGQTGSRVNTYDYTAQYWVKSVVNVGDANVPNYRVDYEYDKRGNKVKEIYPSILINGQTAARIYQYEYDSFGRVTSMTKPDTINGVGVKETYGYDGIGNRTSLTTGRNYTTTYTYNSLGKLSQVTEPNNAVTRYYYDPNSNLVRKISANNLTTEYKYNTLNLLAEQVQARNTQTLQPATSSKFAYDNVGRTKAQSDPLGVVTAFGYYPDGKIAEKVNYVPINTSSSVNLQQVSVTTVPTGYTAEEHIVYTYDKLGNLTNVTDSLGSEALTYDKLNRIQSETRVIDGKSYTTNYKYDFVGNLISIQYPQSTEAEAITYEYNSLNRLTSVSGLADSLKTDPVNKNFMYDAAGNLIQMKYNNNTVTTITPDIMSRPRQISVQVPDTGSNLRVALNLTYSYDANGNVISRNNNTYAYDQVDRLTTAEIDGSMFVNTPLTAGYASGDYLMNKPVNYEGEDVSLSFDYAGNTLGVKFDALKKVNRVELSTTGRADHRITAQGIRVFASSAAGGTFTEILARDWTFSKDAQTGKIVIAFKAPVNAYELKIHANYDDRDTVTGFMKDESQFINYVKSMAKVFSQNDRTRITYAYDAVGNRTVETLTGVGSNYSVTYNYAYYPGSNRLMTHESPASGNMRTTEEYIDGILTYGPADKKAYSYDYAGNLTEKGNSYTISGSSPTLSTTGEGTEYWKYQYDSQNRLKTVYKNGTTNANIIAKYGYDYAGKRLKAVENSKIIHTVYDYAGQAIFEAEYHVDSGDAFTAQGDALKLDKTSAYVYALGHQLAKVEGSMSTGTRYYYHYDNLGSMMMMTKQISTAGENPVVFKQDYTPFGQDLFDSGVVAAPQQQADPNFKFTGQQNDASTGLYYYGARYYDPEIGRFITEDTYEGDLANPLSQNPYIYVLANPLRFNDPTGHRSEEFCVDENVNSDVVELFEGMDEWDKLEQSNVKSEDVRELQTLLTDYGYDVGEINGYFGEKTEAAVLQFQADFHVQQTGAVGPTTRGVMKDAFYIHPHPVPTAEKIKADTPKPTSVPGTAKPANTKKDNANNKQNSSKGASTKGFVQLPNEGTGYGSYFRDPNGNDNWGTPDFVKTLQKIAEEWNKQDSKNTMRFGDLSTKNGEPLPPHNSHKNGTDVDLALFYKGVNVSRVSDGNYNATVCQNFANFLDKNFPQINKIYFGDSSIQGITSSKSEILNSHKTHFHIGF